MRKTFLICLLCVSCSHIVFENEGSLPLDLSVDSRHTKLRRYEGKKEFYLWGMIPGKQNISVDKDFLKVGAREISNVTFGQFKTVHDSWMAILSFGLYTPVHYFVQGYSTDEVNVGE